MPVQVKSRKMSSEVCLNQHSFCDTSMIPSLSTPSKVSFLLKKDNVAGVLFTYFSRKGWCSTSPWVGCATTVSFVSKSSQDETTVVIAREQ